MVVYGDILVLVNMYIDFFLLLLTKRLLHLNTKSLRLFWGCLAGGLSGLLALLPAGKFLQWLTLLLSAALICLISFFDGRLLLYLRCCFCFISSGLILSGGVLLLTELFHIPAAVIAGRVYFDLSPLLLLIFTVLIYATASVAGSLRGPSDDGKLMNFTVLETELGKTEILMKTDTGSSLTEPFSGLPAAVVELEAVRSVLPKAVLDYLGGAAPGGAIRLVPCSSLGGESLLPAFKPERFYLAADGRELNCYLAVTKNRLSSSPWRGLLSPEILK